MLRRRLLWICGGLLGSDENGSPFDIAIEPEPIVCPDAGGGGWITNPPPAARPVQSTGEPSDIDDDLHRWVDGIDIPHEVCTEGHELPQDSGEAIVVGAVGSAAPWFLTGWTKKIKINFMIDMGCQVTILATLVFERMCVSDPQVRSRLHPCGRRLFPVNHM